jgi:hypothetical protein
MTTWWDLPPVTCIALLQHLQTQYSTITPHQLKQNAKEFGCQWCQPATPQSIVPTTQNMFKIRKRRRRLDHRKMVVRFILKVIEAYQITYDSEKEDPFLVHRRTRLPSLNAALKGYTNMRYPRVTKNILRKMKMKPTQVT